MGASGAPHPLRFQDRWPGSPVRETIGSWQQNSGSASPGSTLWQFSNRGARKTDKTVVSASQDLPKGVWSSLTMKGLFALETRPCEAQSTTLPELCRGCMHGALLGREDENGFVVLLPFHRMKTQQGLCLHSAYHPEQLFATSCSLPIPTRHIGNKGPDSQHPHLSTQAASNFKLN